MNDDSGEDWEKFADDEEALDAKLNEDKKDNQEDAEDKVDSDEEREKEKELLKKQREEQPKKVKNKKKDYEEMFEKRLGGKGKAQKLNEEELKGMSAGAKNQIISRKAEEEIADQLFADLGTDSSQLRSVKEYTEFGKKVAKTLYAGDTPYNIPAFFKEITVELGKQCEQDDIKKIIDDLTKIFNEKVKSDKGQGGKKKPSKPQKAQLKGSRAFERDKLATNLLGDEDDYSNSGDEGNPREEEEEVDFM